jgi:hypothetical protein
LSQHFSHAKLSHSSACACGHGVSRVLESRKSNLGRSIRRRRECESCGARWTTYELHEGAIHALLSMAERLSTVRTQFQQASQILQSLAEQMNEEILPEPLQVAEAHVEAKKDRDRAIILRSIPAWQYQGGEGLQVFSVVSDIEAFDNQLVARGSKGEWHMRRKMDGDYFWCKSMGDGPPPYLLEAAYNLDSHGVVKDG